MGEWSWSDHINNYGLYSKNIMMPWVNFKLGRGGMIILIIFF